MYQNNPVLPANTLPTMYDLPSEDPEEMGLPDEFHDFQPDLLRETCQPNTDEFFIGADLNLYYDSRHTGWYKRPDWFLVIGAPASQSIAESRLSYVIWQEGVAPFLMIELLSPGTEAEDLGQTLRVVGKPPTKWQVYEQVLRVPYYAIFVGEASLEENRYSNQFRMFSLQATQYVEQTISDQKFWFKEIELGLGIWSGFYQGMEGRWLRWYDQSGNWVLTNQEDKLQANQRADRQEQLAEQAKQEVDRQQQLAEQAKQEVDRQQQLAEQAKQEADRQQQLAEQATQEADRQRQKNELLLAKLQELGINADEII